MKADVLTLTEKAVEANVAAFDHLSPREKQVAKMVAFGRSSRVIAKALRISIKTLDVHKGRVRKKLGCESAEIPLVVFSALGVVLPFEVEL